MNVKDLKPAIVFEIFDEITRVPRPSKKEEKIREYLLDFAKKHNLGVRTDKIGNVVMTKPATPGHENAPTVIMQGHMDMVCESNDKNFDFENNPITTIVDGEWVRADGTTLGRKCRRSALASRFRGLQPWRPFPIVLPRSLPQQKPP